MLNNIIESNENLNKRISFQQFYLLLQGDDQRKKQIEKICDRLSYYPLNHNYLEDVLFYIHSIEYHYNSFKEKYLIEKEKIKEYLNEDIKIKTDPTKKYLITGFIFNSMVIPNDFVAYITTVKRGIESTLKFFLYGAYQLKFGKSFSLHRLHQALFKESRKFDNINTRLKNNYPDFRESYLKNWDSWLKKLVTIRVEFEHIRSASGFLMEINAMSGFERNGLVANLRFDSKDDNTALLYADEIRDKSVGYIDYMLDYIENHVDNRIDSKKLVKNYFKDLNTSRWFDSPQLIGHIYELGEVSKQNSNRIKNGDIPIHEVKMYDEEDIL
jgi:hypothetical protein